MNTPPNPSSILQTAFGFWGSKVLLTAVELGVFTTLSNRRLTGVALTNALQLHPRANPDFFDALVAMNPAALKANIADLKQGGMLIVNHPDKASDQWMWRPNIGRDQRIALQDRSTRFFGTDFSFEDLEERDVDQYDFKLLADEGTQWKIESRPRKKSQYTYSHFWIKKDNYTFQKVEAYDAKGLVRTIDYRDYVQIKNIWTARTTEVFDVRRNSHTVLKYEKLEYNIPLKEEEFTLQALRRGL